MLKYFNGLKILIGLIMLPLLQINAQTSAGEDSFITVNGDTIRTIINYDNEQKTFSFTDNDTLKLLDPKSVRQFKLKSGERYFSNILEGEFAREVIKGTISMYAVGDYFLLKNQEDSLIILRQLQDTVVRKEIVYGRENKRVFLRKSNTWLGTLYLLVQDCDLIENKELNFTERNIARVLIDYHKCKNLPYQLIDEEIPWRAFNFGLALGHTVSTIDVLHKNKIYGYYPYNFKSSSPAIGVNFFLSFPRALKNINFSTAFLYSNVSYKGEREIETGKRIDYQTVIDYQILSMPVMINYVISIEKMSVSLGGGLEYNLYLDSSIHTEETNLDTGEIKKLGQEHSLSINENQLGLSFKISIHRNYKKSKFGIFFTQSWYNSFGAGYYSLHHYYTASNQISRVGFEIIR